MLDLRRRQFLTLLGGAAAAWPLAARAQQPGKIARVGVLMGYAKGDPEAEGWVRGLIQGLHELRWVEGSNIRIDYRWPSVSVRRLLDSFESLGFDGAHPDSRRGLHCGRTRTGRSTTAIT
jgi:putative ABC transport system substrate-binding protein